MPLGKDLAFVWLLLICMHIWQIIKVILMWFLPENHLNPTIPCTLLGSGLIVQHTLRCFFSPSFRKNLFLQPSQENLRIPWMEGEVFFAKQILCKCTLSIQEFISNFNRSVFHNSCHPIHLKSYNPIFKHLWPKHQSHSTTLRTLQMLLESWCCRIGLVFLPQMFEYCIL